MSFDVYFVRPPGPGEGWGHAMEQFEANAADPPSVTSVDWELWDRIVDAVSVAMPGAEALDRAASRVLDDGTGLQLSMFPGEISLTSPYWHEGAEAERVVERLKAVASAVEGVTGLVAFDPQADAAFLDSGADVAPATFDRVHGVLGEIVASQAPGDPADDTA